MLGASVGGEATVEAAAEGAAKGGAAEGAAPSSEECTREKLLSFIQMVSRSERATLRRGEAVFREGDVADRFYILSEGAYNQPPPHRSSSASCMHIPTSWLCLGSLAVASCARCTALWVGTQVASRWRERRRRRSRPLAASSARTLPPHRQALESDRPVGARHVCCCCMLSDGSMCVHDHQSCLRAIRSRVPA